MWARNSALWIKQNENSVANARACHAKFFNTNVNFFYAVYDINNLLKSGFFRLIWKKCSILHATIWTNRFKINFSTKASKYSISIWKCAHSIKLCSSNASSHRILNRSNTIEKFARYWILGKIHQNDYQLRLCSAIWLVTISSSVFSVSFF